MIASAINCFSYHYEFDSSKFTGVWTFGMKCWDVAFPEPPDPILDTIGDLTMDECRSIYESLRSNCCGSVAMSLNLSLSPTIHYSSYWNAQEGRTSYSACRYMSGCELQITRGCTNA